MELPIVNHPDYVAKINDDNKFPMLLKDLLLQQVVQFWRVNLQSILGWRAILREEVIMQVLMKGQAFVFLMTLLSVLDIYKKKDMQEGY